MLRAASIPIRPTGETLYGGLTQSQYVPESTDVSYRVYNATAIWDLGFGDLTSATSYGENEQEFLVDFTTLLSGFFPGFDSFNRQTTSVQRFTQELRLASHENEKVDWLIGAYYNDEDGLIAQDVHVVERGTFTDLELPFVLGIGTVDSKYKEYAAFANVTIKFTPSFDLTLGGRYSNNDQDVVQVSDGLLFGVAEPTTTPGDSSEDVFTYSIAPKFKINERMAVYARVAKGFRPGGPNVIALDAPEGTPTSYGSDTTLNYELGLKGENEARTFAFDVAAFHIDWDDIQLLARREWHWHQHECRWRGERRRGSHADVPAGRSAETVADRRVHRRQAHRRYGPNFWSVGAKEIVCRIPRRPAIRSSADYEWPLADSRSAYLGASFSHLSEVPAAFDPAFVAENDRQRFLPAYDMLDVRAGWDFGKVSLELFGRNLTDDDGKTSDATGNTPNGAIATGVIRPRSYGVTVTAEF